MDLLIAFILKFINNCLATAKTITVSKGNYLLGATFYALSEFFYMIVMVRVINSGDILSILSVCLAVFLGSYFTGTMFKKTQPQKLWTFDVTSDDLQNGMLFADEIRGLNIPIKTYKTYNSKWEKCLSCEIYCKTKEESILVEQTIYPNFKYNAKVPV